MGLIQQIYTELAFGSSEGRYTFVNDILKNGYYVSKVSLLTLPRIDFIGLFEYSAYPPEADTNNIILADLAGLPVGYLNFLGDFLGQAQRAWPINTELKGSLSPFFANISFLFLFLAMTIYWFDLVFSFSDTKNKKKKVITEKKVDSSSLPVGPTPQLFSGKWDVGQAHPPLGEEEYLTDNRNAGIESFSNLSLTTSVSTANIVLKGPSAYPPKVEARGFSKATTGIVKAPTSTVSLSTFGGSKNPQTVGLFLLGKALFLGKSAIILANISLISLLCIRWKESGHFPLSNLYESLMFLSWSCTFIHLFLIYNNSNSFVGFFSSASSTPIPPYPPLGGIGGYGGMGKKKAMPFFKGSKPLEKLLGSVLAPCALFLNSFATFSLPKEMQQAGPLVPALQSNWLMMHVTVMIVSYAALILGSLLSIAYLIYSNVFTKKAINKVSTSRPTVELGNKKGVKKRLSLFLRPTIGFGLNLESNLDYLSYRIIGIGFPFLTIGILSGAVWANEAWGSYWSWDPKETWALLTWLIFAIYLHTRLTKGWQGEKPAIIASLGFVVVWICYLGVNLLGEGLHSYGFLNN